MVFKTGHEVKIGRSFKVFIDSDGFLYKNLSEAARKLIQDTIKIHKIQSYSKLSEILGINRNLARPLMEILGLQREMETIECRCKCNNCIVPG